MISGFYAGHNCERFGMQTLWTLGLAWKWGLRLEGQHFKGVRHSTLDVGNPDACCTHIEAQESMTAYDSDEYFRTSGFHFYST